jgi:hypothetical protein
LGPYVAPPDSARIPGHRILMVLLLPRMPEKASSSSVAAASSPASVSIPTESLRFSHSATISIDAPPPPSSTTSSSTQNRIRKLRAVSADWANTELRRHLHPRDGFVRPRNHHPCDWWHVSKPALDLVCLGRRLARGPVGTGSPWRLHLPQCLFENIY